MSAHNQERIIHIYRAFLGPDQTLQTILFEFLIDLLVTADLEAAPWHLRVLYPLVLAVDHLVHGDWVNRKGTLLVEKLTIP